MVVFRLRLSRLTIPGQLRARSVETSPPTCSRSTALLAAATPHDALDLSRLSRWLTHGLVHQCAFATKVLAVLENKPELRVAIEPLLEARKCARAFLWSSSHGAKIQAISNKNSSRHQAAIAGLAYLPATCGNSLKLP
jgi:hypothetical protein